MKKQYKVFLLLGSCFLHLFTNAQSGTWVWMNGADTLNSPGNYGTMGVASANNSPPALYEAVQWTDKQGNFWIFGGTQFDMDYSTLWKFSPDDNTWTWVKGPEPSIPDDALPVWGTQGIPDINNMPCARAWGCASWTDTAGDLWLFGGIGSLAVDYYGDLNDLWRYHIATNEWTWMGGSQDTPNQAGAYGILRERCIGCIPPPRSETTTAWTDSNNNLWLFGGFNSKGIPAYAGVFNDIWRYSISASEWEWMGGTNQTYAPGRYGIIGVENANNVPGGRFSYTHWINGNYLYMSGSGPGAHSPLYSDFWRFNLNTNYWTWIGGDSISVPNGHYNDYCTTSGGNEPLGRFEQRSAQINACPPVLFMLGGSSSDDVFNDLWTFDLRTDKWRWISGSNSADAASNYGTREVPAASNMPGGVSGPCFWSDTSGQLWLWGGMIHGENYLNTMWKYIPDNACIGFDTGTANLTFTLSPANICTGDSSEISFNDEDTGLSITPKSYITWIDSSHAILKPDTTTLFTVNGYSACGNYNSQTFTLKVFGDKVNISSNKMALCPGDTAQICAPAGLITYNWSIGNEKTACINATSPGTYQATVTISNQCQAVSNPITITAYQTSAISTNQSGDTLQAFYGTAYQWYKNDTLILNATGSLYIASTPGSYTVQITDSNGCKAISNPYLISGITNIYHESTITVFPNPSNNNWQLNVSAGLIGAEAQVFDATGRIVYKSIITNQHALIDIPGLASGVYELRLSNASYTVSKKLVKM